MFGVDDFTVCIIRISAVVAKEQVNGDEIKPSQENVLPLTKRLPALLATPNWFLATHVKSPASILVTLEIRRLPLSSTVTLWVKRVHISPY